MQSRLNRTRLIVLAVLVIGWLILSALSGLITEAIWFNHLGFGSVFWKVLNAKLVIYAAIFTLTFILFFLNLKLALKHQRDYDIIDSALPPVLRLYRQLILSRLPYRALNIFFLCIGLAVAGYTAYRLDTGWAVWLQLVNRVPFGIADPIFGMDVSFFVFVLPILETIRDILSPLLVWLLPVTFTAYLLFNPSQLIGWRRTKLTFGQRHLLILAGLLFFLLAFHILLKAFRLPLHQNSLFLGAGYTDVYVLLPGYGLSTLCLVTLGMLCLGSLHTWRFKLTLMTGLVSLLIAGISTVALPPVVQRLIVEPNQFAKEKAFLEHHINMTRYAYDLEKVEERQFPSGTGQLDLDKFKATIDNIRLWDWRPLQLSYNQLQALSYYYSFHGIDVDRYLIDGKLRQVMLAAREIDLSRFEAHVQTWTNTRLRYTHGYGLVMSPVDEATATGLPLFLIKDIPPTTVTGLSLERPEIYFGELTGDYVITNTNIKEFDYPQGEDNAETIYQGTGGIPLDNYLKRLLFAARFKDYRLLISNELHRGSQLLMHRQIVDRVQRIAPFLRLDEDPYLVLEDGRLYWLLDAYTTSRYYPYAAMTPGWGNYVRNPVKVVVDAYHGDVDFYVVDRQEPIAMAWQKAFPGMFKNIEDMPAGLQAHLRYPVDLFEIQASIYAKYHMKNPLVFYNDEDAWKIPEEKFQSETVTMEPYYTILQLEGHQEPEFVLMLPFIPAKQIANMVAWMAALNDPPHYGKLIVYKFFKDQHVYGPMQIESRIDQDSEISQQLTLWDQRGSRVIRGNLLVIPLEGAILYVEPIFLQSEQSSIPELSRVIVVFEEQVVMARTLDEALAAILGDSQQEIIAKEEWEIRPSEEPPSYQELAALAKTVFDEAIAAQRQGNWALYGEKLAQLEDVINQMLTLTSTVEEGDHHGEENEIEEGREQHAEFDA